MQIQQAYASLSSSEGKSAAFVQHFLLSVAPNLRLSQLVAARLVIAMLIICLGLIVVLMRNLRMFGMKQRWEAPNCHLRMGKMTINKLEFQSYLFSNKLK